MIQEKNMKQIIRLFINEEDKIRKIKELALQNNILS
ncbi:hypothetical protein M2347_004173 [Chryseobacterium sp. H1D6B]|nr:hypothetical protein [Chryseobacterium sp. H1D6B]